jgi:hypothetical protein
VNKLNFEKNIVKFKFEKKLLKPEVLKLNSLKEIEIAKLNKSPIKWLVAIWVLGLIQGLEDVANPKTGLNLVPSCL